MRIIDLSVALKAGIASDPPSMLPKIEYMDHKQGAQDFAMMFPGLKPEQLPNGEGAAMERITFTTHNGTHLDAPWHFASTMDGGKPAMKIRRDAAGMVLLLGREARLSRQARRLCVQGRRCRTRARPHRLYAQTARHRAGEHRGRHTLTASRIFSTKAAAWAARPRFFCSSKACASPAPTAGAGTRRFHSPPSASSKPATPSLIWEGHKAGRDIGYCHMEKLTNLEALPPFGFKVSCFPVKIEKASAGWTRCVALLDD